MSRCPEQVLLIDYVDDRLSSAVRLELAGHVDGCDACRAVVRELTAPASATHVARESSDARTRLVDPLLGATVGEYRIDERIGEGGMGVVYRGVHPFIGKPVAIKVLRHELLDEPEILGRFVDEARAASAVGHRNIIQIFGFGTLPSGEYYLVMEHLAGEPLSALVSRLAPLPPRLVVDLLFELVSALSAAHAVGVVHRDLKPSNLFVVVEPDGKRLLKVLDFGVAKLLGSERPRTVPGTVLGTPAYMAPEQVNGEPSGPPADLYAVGVIAFELLTGRQPFRGPTSQIMSQHLIADVPALTPTAEPVPAPLEALVRRLLSKEAAERGSAEHARVTLKALGRALPGASQAWLPAQVEDTTEPTGRPVKVADERELPAELRPTRPALPTMPSELAAEETQAEVSAVSAAQETRPDAPVVTFAEAEASAVEAAQATRTDAPVVTPEVAAPGVQKRTVAARLHNLVTVPTPAVPDPPAAARDAARLPGALRSRRWALLGATGAVALGLIGYRVASRTSASMEPPQSLALRDLMNRRVALLERIAELERVAVDPRAKARLEELERRARAARTVDDLLRVERALGPGG